MGGQTPSLAMTTYIKGSTNPLAHAPQRFARELALTATGRSGLFAHSIHEPS
jgi:hypothetical protein